MIYLFHGFGSSAEQSTTVNTLQDHLRPNHPTCPISYPSWSPADTAAQVRETIGDPGPEPCFIGVSLGGFWARYFANQFSDSRLFLINPSVNAPVSVRKFAGETVNGHIIPESFGDDHLPYRIDSDRKGMPIGVVVATDDTVVDPKMTIDTYQNRPHTEFIQTTGGHRLRLDASHLAAVDRLLAAPLP